MIEEIREFRRLLRRFEQQTQIQTNSCCEISMPHCLALLEIEHFRKSSLKQLSENLGLDTSTLSRTVDGLVNLELVQRTPDPKDRRYLVLALTAKGQEVCSEINARSDLYYRQVFEAIPEENRQEVMGAFQLFVEAMQLPFDKP